MNLSIRLRERVDLTRSEGVYYMGKVRKHIRNLHDGTEDGERLFDAIVEEGRVTIELKTSKKQLVRVPWEDIVTQVDAAKHTSVPK
jgi:hypothetical protein